MDYHTLFTYSSVAELREIEKECNVVNFSFDKTYKILEDSPDICIDITSLVYLLEYNKQNIQAAYDYLKHIRKDTKIIAHEEVAKVAIELLPLLISKTTHYTLSEDEQSFDSTIKIKPIIRQKIYRYNNLEDLEKIINYTNEHNIPFISFATANSKYSKELEQLNKFQKMVLIDLTSIAYVFENNKGLIYMLEQFLIYYPNVKVLAQNIQIDNLIKYLPLIFSGEESINNLIPDLNVSDEEKPEESEVRTITKLDDTAFKEFLNNFNKNLIGHNNFKNVLNDRLKKFILLNRLKEQKVFSIFLFGPSGIGKTEVARLIANSFKNGSYLAKINFQNYSSKDSLNSLIGSPAGYIGCEHGELSEKIKKSKVGVILCDEFEKTTRPVFSFFLELLEDGKFTDSMAREYDLDGYIIIFTSNISNEEEYINTIPVELQTRFDLVCEFTEPTRDEKDEFLDFLLDRAKIKYSEQFDKIDMNEDDKKQLYDFNYYSISSFRDIKREFNNRLMEFFISKKLI